MNKQETAIANFRAKVKKSNAVFKKSSKASKRVQIAKDVLEQLKLKRMHAERGMYFEVKVKGWDQDRSWGQALENKDDFKSRNSSLPKDTQVQDALFGIPSCNVCALGAVFTATVERCDKLKVSDLNFLHDSGSTVHFSSGEMHKYLISYFSREQLVLIEDAFEGAPVQDDEDGTYGCQTESPLRRKAEKFNKGARSDTKRLERIMNNIVKNNGTFIP